MKNSESLERLDDLLLGGMKLYQREDQFCFSIDAVMLAHFMPVKAHKRYVDLGTGTAVIPHILVHRGATHVTGIEVNPMMAALSRKSVAYNHLEEAITIVDGDYRHMTVGLKSYDGAVINPPYFEVGRGHLSEASGMRQALHEVNTTLDEVIRAACTLIKDHGYIWLIHRSERLQDIMQVCGAHDVSIKRVRFVHGTPQKASKLVLIEGRLRGNSGLIVEPPLYTHGVDGTYSEEVRSWYES